MAKQVVLQPAGQAAATIHYQDTIATPVSLNRIKPHLRSEDFDQLMHIYPDGVAPVWGVTPGKNDQNEKRWERMNVGDIVLFAKQGAIFSTGAVTFKVHSKPIALELWKVNADGETWEFVYFLKSMRGVNIPYSKFNVAAGYEPNNVIQGFQVLSEEKSTSILDLLNLRNEDVGPAQNLVSDLATAADKEGAFDPNDEADGRKRELASIVRRQGQPKFRKQLLELYEGRCAISGFDAVAALEAAHIIPYNGDKTNHPCNGLLLRSDLHTLFDLGLLTVDSSTMQVTLASPLFGTTYAALAGKTIRLPRQSHHWPSKEALA